MSSEALISNNSRLGHFLAVICINSSSAVLEPVITRDFNFSPKKSGEALILGHIKSSRRSKPENSEM